MLSRLYGADALMTITGSFTEQAMTELKLFSAVLITVNNEKSSLPFGRLSYMYMSNYSSVGVSSAGASSVGASSASSAGSSIAAGASAGASAKSAAGISSAGLMDL